MLVGGTELFFVEWHVLFHVGEVCLDFGVCLVLAELGDSKFGEDLEGNVPGVAAFGADGDEVVALAELHVDAFWYPLVSVLVSFDGEAAVVS